jgi:hypothetical protein
MSKSEVLRSLNLANKLCQSMLNFSTLCILDAFRSDS